MSTTTDLQSKTLAEIAGIIHANWGDIWFGARPYVQAMGQLSSVDDHYGVDRGDMIVRYFLSNARQWRGPVAREVKAELKRRVG